MYYDTMVRSPLVPLRTSATACCQSLGNGVMANSDAEGMARIFAALSDPVRLRLLSMIAAAGEICSCDLQAPLGKSQPTISHHTRILVDVGLIVGEKRGRWTWWHVAPDQLQAVARFLSA